MQTFYEAIYEWVKQNFGESEADNPSWNIEALADHLSNTDIKPDELNASTKWLAYSELKEHFLEEDIENVAEQRGLTLSKVDIETIKHRYYKLDDETWEQLSIIMDDMKGELNANHN